MQEVPCTQWYTLHTMATLFNNHPYISATCVGMLLLLLNVNVMLLNVMPLLCATATYVGVVVE